MGQSLDDLELLGSKELAEKFGLPKRTIQYLFQTGKLPGLKIGRSWKARVSDVRTYLESQRAAATVKESL